jgi:hypothetical protein
MTAKTLACSCCLIGVLTISCDNDPVEKEPEPVPLDFYAYGQVRDENGYWETTKFTLMDGHPDIDEVVDGASQTLVPLRSAGPHGEHRDDSPGFRPRAGVD